MSKVRVTTKELNRAYADYYKVYLPYCDLQEYVEFLQPLYYTSGTYGWNCDGYVLQGDYLLTTGYRSLLGKKLEYSDSDITELKHIRELYKRNLITHREAAILIEEMLYCLAYNTFKKERETKLAKYAI